MNWEHRQKSIKQDFKHMTSVKYAVEVPLEKLGKEKCFLRKRTDS